jgi:putative DNA primase/helicase
VLRPSVALMSIGASMLARFHMCASGAPFASLHAVYSSGFETWSGMQLKEKRIVMEQMETQSEMMTPVVAVEQSPVEAVTPDMNGEGTVGTNSQAGGVLKPRIRVSSLFTRDESGLYFEPQDSTDNGNPPKPEFVCSRIDVVATTRNDQGEDWGRLVQFPDADHNMHRIAMPMEMFAAESTEARATLLRAGLLVGPTRKARERLSQFIQMQIPKARARCVSRVGWNDDMYVLPDETFGEAQEGELTLFQSTSSTDHFLRSAGSLEDWQSKVGRLCRGNSRLVFAVSAAFAGALVKLAGEESGGFHLRGGSSTGKSTAMIVAGSVWGGGGRNGYLRSWRTTSNALEAVAEIHNDGLLCLDEMAQVDPKDAGNIAYMIANGEGKARMTKSIGTRRTLNWSLLLLSSGEISLEDHVRTAGHRIKGGQQARLVDLAADAGKGMGLFEDIHDSATPDAFARRLTAAAKAHYGVPIRAFLRHVISYHPGVESLVRSAREALLKHAAGAIGEISRVAGRFALVAVAGELATSASITGWSKGDATASAEACFKSWLQARGHGAADTEAAIRQIRAFIEAHGSSRFEEGDHWGASSAADMGGAPAASRVVTNRVGFIRRVMGDEIEYCCLPEAFRQQLCQAYDPKAVAVALRERGYLVAEDGRNTVRRNMPGSKKQQRVYAIRSTILDGDLEL